MGKRLMILISKTSSHAKKKSCGLDGDFHVNGLVNFGITSDQK